MEQTKTIAQEAYDLLKDIPSKDFIIGKFTDYNSKCCAIGHLVRLKNNPSNYENCSDIDNPLLIRKISSNYINSINSFAYDIASVNNGYSYVKYKQKTPKGRVIALLKDMIKAGY